MGSKKTHKTPILTVGILILFFVSSVFAQENAAAYRTPVKIPGKKILPLRVLARPMSNLYKKPDENSVIVEENVPVFQNYFVYTRPDQTILETKTEGWYELGSDNRGNILGWMKAQDVMEWKQTMCLSYEHPQGRKPVLMFRQIEPLREMIKSPPEERKKQALSYYATIESGDIPDSFPIVSVEPEGAIDIAKNFYLLPILEHAVVEIQGREGRLLKLASAPKEGRSPVPPMEEGTDDFVSPETPEEPPPLENLKMDLVYVVDMTASMQPYVDASLTTIRNLSLLITQKSALKGSIRFGLWGYRDSLEIPGIEFVTKNYTPQLREVDQFEQILKGVKVVRVGSKGYDEDVFSGMDKAMRETQWTEGAMRFIILIGDAPAHGPGHKWNLSKQSEETLRQFADDNKINVFSVHIKDKKAKKFWDTAEFQFKTLSVNKGSKGKSAYFDVDSKDLDGYSKISQQIARQLVDIMEMAKSGRRITTNEPPKPSPAIAKPPEKTDVSDIIDEEEVAETVRNVGYAALVEWLGSVNNIQAPRDIIAWVTDKDLIDPTIQALDVRILVNKRQLDSLTTVLQKLLEAGSRGFMTGGKFFNELQTVSGISTRDLEKIKAAKTFAETGLVPEFIDGLPYKSQIMSMSDDLWSSWGADQQKTFLDNLNSKIQYFTNVHDSPSGWVPLNKGDDPDEFVYPMSLEMLP